MGTALDAAVSAARDASRAAERDFQRDLLLRYLSGEVGPLVEAEYK